MNAHEILRIPNNKEAQSAGGADFFGDATIKDEQVAAIRMPAIMDRTAEGATIFAKIRHSDKSKDRPYLTRPGSRYFTPLTVLRKIRQTTTQ
jgi:hypothetical protein